MNTLVLFSLFCAVIHVHTAVIDPLTRCPLSLPRSWHLFAWTDTCLEIVHDERSWGDARNHCKQLGGDLVVIQDLTKQQYIMNALKSLNWDRHGVWIGVTDSDKEGDWRWVTGDTMTWSNWAPGQGVSEIGFLFAKGTLEDCAQIRTDDGYMWYDYPCSGGIGFHYSSICEYPATSTGSVSEINIPTTASTTHKTTHLNKETTLHRTQHTTPMDRETPQPTQFPDVETPPSAIIGKKRS